MTGFIDIHTHRLLAENAIINLYQDFEQSSSLTNYSIGFHPWYLEKANDDWGKIKEFSTHKNILAIGECGLDKVCNTDWNLQIQYFKKQIDWAQQIQKPLIIHCVKAYNECLEMLKGINVPVIFHGFNRNANIAETILKQGHYLSFGKALLQDNFKPIFENITLEAIFFETDDAPITIQSIYKIAAEIKKIALDSLILQIEKNFEKVF